MQAHKRVGGSLRPPSGDEWFAIEAALKECGAAIPKEYTLLVHQLRYREVYAFHDNLLLEVAKRISAQRNIYFAGLFAGSFRGGRFKLGLEMAEHLYTIGQLKNVVEVDEEHERRFLYGKNIPLPKGVGLADGVVALVVNGSGDALGLARLEGGFLVNLVDKGWYLRKGH